MEIRKLNKTESERLLTDLEDMFGFSRSIWDGYDFLLGTKNRVFIVSKNLLGVVNGLWSVTQGFLFARLEGSVKPSTNMIQVWGNLAKKNLIELDQEQAKKYMNGEDLELAKETIYKNNLADGYVVVKHKNKSLGCGLLKDGNLKNQVPKGKRMNIELL